MRPTFDSRCGKNDPESFEILRVWVAEKQQHVSLRIAVWEDPAAWGIMLADLLKQIVNSFEQDTGLERKKTMERIKSAFEAEMGNPTDNPSGRIKQ